MRKFLTVLLIVGALSACGRREPLQSSSRLTVVENSGTLPPPDREDLTVGDRPSLIGPLDTIQVDVFNVPDLSRDLQVDASGRISMPLAGTIEASGKTAEELARAIASAKGMSEYGRQDDVVILRTVNGHRMAGLYNVAAIRRGQYDDPSIYANDVIVVGDSPQRRLFRDFVSLSPLIAGPLIAILQ